MRNPKTFCPICQREHGNAIIALFNKFIEKTCPDERPTGVDEIDIYRAYVSGQHDCLSLILKLSDKEEEVATSGLNRFAIQLRDAVMAGMEDMSPELKAKVHATITERFLITEICHDAN